MTVMSNPFRVEITPPAGAMPAWRSSAELLTWFEIPGTTLLDQAAALGLTSTEAGNLTAFSSGAWNGADFYIHGGGHTDIAGNGVYRLRLGTDTPEYSVTVPARPAGTRDAATTDDGYYYPIVGGVEEPVEMHSYWQCAVDATSDRFFRFGSGGQNSALDGRAPTMDAAVLSTGAWDGKGVYPNIPVNQTALDALACSMDDQRRFWLIASPPAGGTGRLQAFSFASLSWTDYGVANGSSSGDTPLIYDPVRKRLFRTSTGSFADRAQTIDIGDSWDGVSAPVQTWRTLVGASGVDVTKIRRYAAMVYCPDRDSYLLIDYLDRGMLVYEINPDDFTVTHLSIAGTPPTLPTTLGGKSYYYHRWQYIDAMGGVFFMPRHDGNCFFIRTR